MQKLTLTKEILKEVLLNYLIRVFLLGILGVEDKIEKVIEMEY